MLNTQKGSLSSANPEECPRLRPSTISTREESRHSDCLTWTGGWGGCGNPPFMTTLWTWIPRWTPHTNSSAKIEPRWSQASTWSKSKLTWKRRLNSRSLSIFRICFGPGISSPMRKWRRWGCGISRVILRTNSYKTTTSWEFSHKIWLGSKVAGRKWWNDASV